MLYSDDSYLKINKADTKDTIPTELIATACMYENIFGLLGPAYNPNYSEPKQDAELIATFVQVIVSDCYSEETQKITAPFAKYWSDVVTPKFLDYIGNSSVDSCGLINEYPFNI